MRPSVVLTVIGVTSLAIALAFPWGEETKEQAKRSACFSNVKRRTLALVMYAEDVDGRFPRRERWMDATAIILRTKPPFYEGGDPDLERELRCPAVSKIGYGYAFNAGLSGAKVPPHPESAPLVYDSTSLARNASDPVSSLPSPGRHEGKDNVAYADGHAKAMEVR